MTHCFLGQYSYSIDSQRRVPIPSEWRTGLEFPAVFYLLPGRGQTVHVMPEAVFEQQILSKLSQISFANTADALTLRRMGGRAHRCTCDKQGRIALSAKLLAHANLTDQAVLVGSFNSIQIVNPDEWEADDFSTDDMLDEIERIQGTE